MKFTDGYCAIKLVIIINFYQILLRQTKVGRLFFAGKIFSRKIACLSPYFPASYLNVTTLHVGPVQLIVIAIRP